MTQKDSAPVSNDKCCIIICTNRRHPGFEDTLISCLTQKYTNFRVLVIDNSLDACCMALHRQTALSYSSLSFYHYPCNSKKEALTYALTKMEDEHILLTDDDCMPYSSSWLPAMLYCLDENELDIVLGYSPFKKLNNSVFTSWCVYENLLSSLLYLSMANSGMAYMGVGRNIMYRKNILNRSVLDKNKDLASGDDDLSVNTLSSSHKVGICLLNDSFVFTKPPANWSAYWRQKTRHYNTAHRYKIYHIILLSFYSITHYSFFVGLLILLFSEVNGLGQELSGY